MTCSNLKNDEITQIYQNDVILKVILQIINRNMKIESESDLEVCSSRS